MYNFKFYQACMEQTQLVYKVGWGYNEVYTGENLGKTKKLIYFFLQWFF
jgi:hypothetical protein